MTDRIDWASPPLRHPGPVVYYTWQGVILPQWLVDRLLAEATEAMRPFEAAIIESIRTTAEPVRQGELDDALASMEDTEWWRRAP